MIINDLRLVIKNECLEKLSTCGLAGCCREITYSHIGESIGSLEEIVFGLRLGQFPLIMFKSSL